jgi:hypothetical protein
MKLAIMIQNPPAPTLSEARWLPHRYDPQADTVHFVDADRARRAEATFLTDEHLKGPSAPTVVHRPAALNAAPAPAPIHYIFHSAYCCSTLLAKLLDLPGIASTLKEPVILNDMVGWRHRGGNPRHVAAVLDNMLTLLAKPFATGEAVVVKPSNVVNALAPAMLTMRPESRAVLLYAPLRVYLTSIARKGMWGRLWVRDLLAKQITDNLIDLGFEPADYLRLTDLQAAAVGWVAQADLFARLADQFPERVRSLDSEVLTARPKEVLAALAALYGWDLPTNMLDAMAAEESFAHNAKDGSRYAPADRIREQVDGASLHADEIDKVFIWAEAVARNAGVVLVPPAPLLDT